MATNFCTSTVELAEQNINVANRVQSSTSVFRLRHKPLLVIDISNPGGGLELVSSGRRRDYSVF
jgi:hypothetical protein